MLAISSVALRYSAHNSIVMVMMMTMTFCAGDGVRRFRHAKRFMAVPSPLPAVQWWRVSVATIFPVMFFCLPV